MKCEKAQELFSDYLEGTLERPMEFMLEHHLHDCHACEQDYNRFCQTWEALDAMPEVEVPMGLHARVMEKIQAQPAKKERKWSFDLASIFGARIQVRAVAAAAAAVLLVAMAVQVPYDHVVKTDVQGVSIPETVMIGDNGNNVVAPGIKTQTYAHPGLDINVLSYSDNKGTTHYTIELKPNTGENISAKAYITQNGAVDSPEAVVKTGPVVFNKIVSSGKGETFPMVVGKDAGPEAVYITWDFRSKPRSAVINLQTK
jgi:hypothetical protein